MSEGEQVHHRRYHISESSRRLVHHEERLPCVEEAWQATVEVAKEEAPTPQAGAPPAEAVSPIPEWIDRSLDIAQVSGLPIPWGYSITWQYCGLQTR